MILAHGVAVVAWGSLVWGVFDYSAGLFEVAPRVLLATVLASLGLGGLLAAHGGSALRMRPRLSHGAESLCGPLIVVSLFPLLRLLFPDARALTVALVALAAAAFYAPAPPFAVTRALPFAVTRAREWPLVTLSMTIFAVATYLVVGHRLTGSTNNDAAYYYGVARHMSETGRYEEAIVWQHLIVHPSVVHRPFDYWHGATAVSLVPVFMVFGSSYPVLGTAMAVVSSVTLVLFWYLVSVAARLQSAWVQVTSILLFAFSPALLAYRFDAETVPFAQLWLLASLVAFAKERRVLGLILAFVMFFFRADTAAVLLILSGFAFLLEMRTGWKRGLSVLAAASAMTSAYVGYHMAMFHSVSPPATQMAPFLLDGGALYDWHFTRPAVRSFSDLFDNDYVDGRVYAALDAYHRSGFFAHTLPWLVLGSATLFRRQRALGGLDVLVSVVALLGASVVAWSTTPVFAHWRTLHPLLPALVLSGAYGADGLLGRVSAARQSLLARALACALSVSMTYSLRPYTSPPAPHPAVSDMLQARSHFEPGPVMALFPWFVLAYSENPAVGIPYNGAEAIAAAIAAYDVRSLLLVGRDPCPEESLRVCQDIVTGRRTQVGGYTLQKAWEASGLVVMRVVRP